MKIFKALKFDGKLILPILISVVLLICWIPFYFYITWDEIEKASISELYSLISAFFGGIGIPLIVYTIVRQQQEIRGQELNSKIQGFENAFFQLINLYHNITKELILDKNKITYGVDHINNEKITGKEIFSVIYQEMAISFKNNSDTSIACFENVKQIGYLGAKENTDNEQIDLIIKVYVKIFKENKQVLSHSIRNIYHVFKYIHCATFLTHEQKQYYVDIVRGQLSNDELLIFFYNSFVEELGWPKFNYLIQQYDIIESLDESAFLFTQHKKLFYKSSIKKDPFEII